MKLVLEVFEHEGLNVGQGQLGNFGQGLPTNGVELSIATNVPIQLLSSGIEKPRVETDRILGWSDSAAHQVQSGQVRGNGLLVPGRPGTRLRFARITWGTKHESGLFISLADSGNG